jgi:hypothetical protein
MKEIKWQIGQMVLMAIAIVVMWHYLISDPSTKPKYIHHDTLTHTDSMELLYGVEEEDFRQ